jgi:hypothetical protein
MPVSIPALPVASEDAERLCKRQHCRQTILLMPRVDTCISKWRCCKAPQETALSPNNLTDARVDIWISKWRCCMAPIEAAASSLNNLPDARDDTCITGSKWRCCKAPQEAAPSPNNLTDACVDICIRKWRCCKVPLEAAHCRQTI